MAHYEKAVELLYRKDFKQAGEVLRQMKQEFPGEVEILARAEHMARICEARLQASDPSKAGAEELYTSGLVEHNVGNYEEALKYYRQALEKSKSNGDYIHFALAATESRRGNAKKAIEHLAKALAMNPDNRFLARRDPDFSPLAGEDGFRKLMSSPDRS